jgi:imidazolonepropionase-like amidohydrolase
LGPPVESNWRAFVLPGYLFLRNATVIDGSGGDPMEKAAVLVKDERIVAVGSVDRVRPPSHEDVVTVDVTGKTIMPGMIDCHFHGAYHGVTCWEDYDLRRSIEHTTLLAARNAQTLLEVGFTSARDVGSRGLVAVAVRDMIEAGVLTGPRLRAGSRIISSTGGLADAYGDWVENRSSLGEVVDGTAEVLKAVRHQVKYGVNNIKLEASGTGISPYSESGKQTLTMEEMAVAVGEAHRNGVRVAAHAQATEGIKNAVRAGVDTIEHGSFMDEEGADLMKRAGTILVPTISVLYLYVHKGPEVGVPEWVVDKFRGDLDAHMESVRLALSKGIPMVLGSDSGHSFNPQSIIAIELELMVQTGFTPMQALLAATSLAARAIGTADDVGKLEPGKFADMLVVDGDPLSDISVLQDKKRLERVYKGGALLAGSLAPRREEIELGYDLAPEPPVHTDGAHSGHDSPCC